jgi:hypothetical protein
MRLILKRHFDHLKNKVQEEAGYAPATSADCKIISIIIFRKTGHQVSETTLKRVFGFAQSKFMPSQFTMNALSEFCGYKSWEDFCNIQNGLNVSHESTAMSWDETRHSATKITGATLSALKNRSGIPFGYTIPRPFVRDFFSGFLKNGCNGAILTSPAGYGKTLALCHWVESRLQTEEDIFLFFSGHTLTNVFSSGKALNEWVLSLLGYGGVPDLQFLLDSEKKRMFYLIVDGLDEHLFNRDGYRQLMEQLLDIFALYKDYACFKLVLTMRSANWVTCQQEFGGFSGWYAAELPLFSRNELEAICARIDPLSRVPAGAAVIENLLHPLYFQFYYQRNKCAFSLFAVDRVTIYDLVSDFVHHKVHQGKYAEEKVMIIRALAGNMDMTEEVYEVAKSKICGLLTNQRYRQAYLELLGAGLLKETMEAGHLKFRTVIRFERDDYLDYSLGMLLLLNNNNKFDSLAAARLNEIFPQGRKLAILKWCVFYAAMEQGGVNLDCVIAVKLSVPDELELIGFSVDIKKRHLIHLDEF